MHKISSMFIRNRIKNDVDCIAKGFGRKVMHAVLHVLWVTLCARTTEGAVSPYGSKFFLFSQTCVLMNVLCPAYIKM